MADFTYHWITTTEVLQRTMMSRTKLLKLVREERFPPPKGRKGKEGYLFNAAEVHDWIQKNSFFAQQSCFVNADVNSVAVKLKGPEMKEVKDAARGLGCSAEKFISDAAVAYARRVLELMSHES